MITQTTGQQKKLQELQEMWDYARNSEVRKQWRDRYKQNLKFYYGDQWDEKLKKEFQDTGAIPFVVNRIEPIITTQISLQINARKRITTKPTTDLKKHVQLSTFVDRLFCNIQAQSDFQNQSTLKYKDALIGGLGWSTFYYDENSSNPFIYEWIDPFEMFPDPDDTSPRYTKSNVQHRSYFVPVVKLNQTYPKFAPYFNSMIDFSPNSSGLMYEDRLEDSESGLWVNGRSIRIVETYYKENAKYYETTIADELENPDDPNAEITERLFTTFDKEEALAKKAEWAEIIEKEGTRIMKGVFTDGVLLEHGALYPQVPNQTSFPIVPLCLQRNWMGVPYGIVDGLIPLSTALNYIWTKTIHGLGSKFLIIEKTPEFDSLKHGDEIIKQMTMRYGVAALKQAKDAQLINYENLLPYLFNALQRIDIEFEQRTQLFDELKGNQTNAVSGVAIQQRAINAARTQIPLNAAYDHMLFTEGRLMLDTIKGLKDFNYTFSYYQSGKVNNAVISNDIATINFDLVQDIAPNFTTSNDELTARFEGLVTNPAAMLILSDPVFIEKLGFSEDDALTLHEAYKRVTQQQAHQQEAQNQQAQQ